jgi:hypothetical protein
VYAPPLSHPSPIIVGKRGVGWTEEVSPDLLVDYAADGSPLGLEILSPATVTIERVWAVFDAWIS